MGSEVVGLTSDGMVFDYFWLNSKVWSLKLISHGNILIIWSSNLGESMCHCILKQSLVNCKTNHNVDIVIYNKT